MTALRCGIRSARQGSERRAGRIQLSSLVFDPCLHSPLPFACVGERGAGLFRRRPPGDVADANEVLRIKSAQDFVVREAQSWAHAAERSGDGCRIFIRSARLNRFGHQIVSFPKAHPFLPHQRVGQLCNGQKTFRARLAIRARSTSTAPTAPAKSRNARDASMNMEKTRG